MEKLHARKPGLRLRLYIAGNAPNSVSAATNARAICEEFFHSRYELEVVDMLEEPHRALADEIIVTPTLLRLLPTPIQRIIGDLSDREQVLIVLGDE